MAESSNTDLFTTTFLLLIILMFLQKRKESVWKLSEKHPPTPEFMFKRTLIFLMHNLIEHSDAMMSIVHECQRLLITNIIMAQYHGLDFQQPINCNVLVHNHLESCFISASFKGWMYPRQLVSSYITDGNSRGYSGHCFTCFHVKPKRPRDMAGWTPKT